MATNKNAQLRFHILDRCFSSLNRKFEINDLLEEVNDKLSEASVAPISLRTLRSDIEGTRHREVDGVAAGVVHDGVVLRVLDHQRTCILGCDGAQHFCHISTIGKRVGIENLLLLLVDVELVVAASDTGSDNAVASVIGEQMAVAFKRSERETRNGCVVVISVFLVFVAQAGTAEYASGKQQCEGHPYSLH